MALGKRASYREGIEYIAYNDEPLIRDARDMEAYATVQMLSVLFDLPAAEVARAVVAYRKKYNV